MSPARKSSRRDFLTGKSATGALTDLIDRGAGDLGVDWTDTAAQPYLLHFTRQAMACEFQLSLNAGQYADAPRRALAALDLVEQLEEQLTVYRDSSEVMDINRRAGKEPVQAEPRLFALLEQCQRLCQETQGAFDVTSGPLTKVWGFYRRQGRLPGKDDVRQALKHVGCDKIELDGEKRTIRFQVPEMEINLGSIGKGYALDRCGEELTASGIEDFFWHGGRSSVLAHGAKFGHHSGEESDKSNAGWKVGVADPLRPGRRLGHLLLRGRGLGTSGSGAQFFRHQGKRYGHILDPRTGWPVENVVSVTVLAPTAAEADALATAFYTMGPDLAVEYCRQRPQLGMFMVHREGGAVQIKTAGLNEQELTMSDGK